MSIKPMLLTEIPTDESAFEQYKGWLWQEKQNGDRAIIHIKDGKIVAMRNRRDSPVLHFFPELKALTFNGIKDAIVDGEICVFDDNQKSIFYGGINQRDKKLYPERVEQYPIIFVAFDLILLNGVHKYKDEYQKRYSELKASFSNSQHFKVAELIDNPAKYWKDKIVAENREGLVIKNPKALYEFDTRSKQYLKLKNYKQTDVVIDNLESNNAGTKVYGKAVICGNQIDIECQFGGIDDLQVGQKVPVQYLDIVGKRLIQPHKIKGWKNGNCQ